LRAQGLQKKPRQKPTRLLLGSFFKKKIKKRVKNWQRLMFNHHKFAERLGKKINTVVRVRACNLFLYLLKKYKITFKTHQRHYWNRKYKYQRYFYAHYYDIVNAF